MSNIILCIAAGFGTSFMMMLYLDHQFSLNEYSVFPSDIYSKELLAGVLITFLVMLAEFIFLGITAGRHDEKGDIIIAGIDHMWSEWHLAVSAFICIGFAGCAVAVFGDYYSQIKSLDHGNVLLAFSVISLMCAAATAFFTEWLMSCSRTAKAHVWGRYTLFYKLFVKGGKKIRNAMKFDKEPKLGTRMHQVTMYYAVMNAVIGLLVLVFSRMETLFFAVLAFIVLCAVNIKMMMTAKQTIESLDKMDEALADAQNGNFEYELDTNAMPDYLKPMGDRVNDLRSGIKTAVDAATKEEHMRSELITNVSHDLKTPLTAIINYVDLLKKCDIKDKDAKEYIGVLDEKSMKLKKLIEDLTEASKASSGKVSIELMDLDLCEFALQMQGEYEDSFTDAGLTLVTDLPGEPVVVRADSGELRRVLDNLLTNALKYSLRGTRVFFSVSNKDGAGKITVKNTSERQLEKTADELMQRFVRGDDARTGDGSGLGLSIARSLTELMEGTFMISTDGDMFKAEITLKE